MIDGLGFVAVLALLAAAFGAGWLVAFGHAVTWRLRAQAAEQRRRAALDALTERQLRLERLGAIHGSVLDRLREAESKITRYQTYRGDDV